MSSRILLAALFSAVGVAACGGGGSNEPSHQAAAPAPAQEQSAAPAPATAPAPAPATTLTAAPAPAPAPTQPQFVADTRPHVSIFSPNRQSIGQLTTHWQHANGEVLAFNEFSLNGEYGVSDSKSLSSYAAGVWTAGSVQVNGSSVDTLSESAGKVWHYMLFNKPASLPASGSLACELQYATRPSLIGANSASDRSAFVHESTQAYVTFGPTEALINMGLDLRYSGRGESLPAFVTQISPSVNTAAVSGTFTGSMAQLTFAADDAGYAIVGGYTVPVAGGAKYIGAFRLKCF